jgi:hypothetical protein
MFGGMIEGDQSRVMQDLRQKLSAVGVAVFLPPKFDRNGEMSMVRIEREKISCGAIFEHEFQMIRGSMDESARSEKFFTLKRGGEFSLAEVAVLRLERMS